MAGSATSGGHNRLSDEEKKRRGTFRPSRSAVVYDGKQAARVVKGPWLETIPPPEFKLTDAALKKYDEFTRILFDSNKLTTVTRMQAEAAAMMHGQIVRRSEAGEDIPASLFNQLQSVLRDLKIAEEAPEIATPGNRPNKFKACGFPNRRRSKAP